MKRCEEIKMNNIVTNLQLFRIARKRIFDQMDKDVIAPERADEILTDASTYAASLPDTASAEDYAQHLADTFTELEGLADIFVRQRMEQLDTFLRVFVEYAFSAENPDKAGRLFRLVADAEEHPHNCLSELQIEYPEAYQAAAKIAEPPHPIQ